MKFSYFTVLAFASVVIGQVTLHSGLNIAKCLDLAQNIQTAGNNIRIYDCNGSGAQQWVPDLGGSAIHLFENQSNCLDGGPAPAVGADMWIGPCNPTSPAQRFSLTTNGEFIELGNTALCIGVPSDNTANGNVLQLEACNPNDSGQVWHAVPLA